MLTLARSPAVCRLRRVNAIACCVLSSKGGFVAAGYPDALGLKAPSKVNSNIGRNDGHWWDPTVLALWSGNVDPQTAEAATFADPFAKRVTAASYAQKLLESGVPALPREDKSYLFLRKVFDSFEDAFPSDARLALRRIDADYEPSMLAYRVPEISFGPGKGKETVAGTDTPLEYFGTGWSTTMWVPIVSCCHLSLASYPCLWFQDGRVGAGCRKLCGICLVFKG